MHKALLVTMEHKANKEFLVQLVLKVQWVKKARRVLRVLREPKAQLALKVQRVHKALKVT